MLKELMGRLGMGGANPEVDEYKLEIKRAWEEWQSALSYFNSVTEPELIDFAIYDVEATRRRYVYMLRKAEDVEREVGLESKLNTEAN